MTSQKTLVIIVVIILAVLAAYVYARRRGYVAGPALTPAGAQRLGAAEARGGSDITRFFVPS